MKHWSIIILLLLFFACDDKPKELSPELLEIEGWPATRPDSALATLESLYPGNRFDKYNRAYYYLLLAEARYDKGISLLDTDSAITVALNYFDKHRALGLFPRASLWKGRVWEELDQFDRASDTYLKGIEAAEKEHAPPKIISKLYDDLGNSYLYEGLHDKALEMFRREYALDESLGDHRGLAFSLRNIGSAYHFMTITDTTELYADSALYYYQEALAYARLSKDSLYLSDILYNDISIWYKGNDEYERALLYADSICHLEENVELNKASILIGLNRLDSAANILSSLVVSNDIGIRAVSNSYFSRLEQKKGNNSRALAHYKIYDNQKDSIYRKRQTAELKAVDHLHNIEQATAAIKSYYKARNYLIIAGAIVLLLIIAALFIYITGRHKRAKMEKERDLLSLKADLLEKEKRIEELTNQIADLNIRYEKIESTGNEDIEELRLQIEEKEKEIANLKDEIKNQRFSTKHIYEILKQIESNKSGKLNAQQQEELKKEINLSFPEYILKLNKEYSSIKELDIWILCLMKADFKPRAIGLFFNRTESAIRKRIERLEKKSVSS